VRDPGPDDKDRFVVVGHPYDDAVDPDGSYEVLALSSAGVLTTTGTRFPMGPPADEAIVFTPDGEIGFAVQDDGTLGVFRLDAAGVPTVLDAAFSDGGFYAGALTMSEDGGTLWVVDPNFPENGGGVYGVSIACDGTLTGTGRAFEAKSGAAYFDLGGGHAFLAARGALGSTEVAHAHRIAFDPTPGLVASVDAFGDDEAILSWAALARGGRHVLLGDNSAFASSPNRVAAVEITTGGLAASQLLTGIDDPYSIAMSPFDDAAIVTSGFGDAIYVLDYDPSAAAPLSIRGELAYAGSGPQLPGALAMVTRGGLDGRVFIADVRGVYVVRFGAGADVEDLDVFDLGGGVENVVAGIGVVP
jgi:hypothetical protein